MSLNYKIKNYQTIDLNCADVNIFNITKYLYVFECKCKVLYFKNENQAVNQVKLK